jgi:WD40 repeat protein
MELDESNPYVGPRPFERKKEDTARFFGRSQETDEIVSLIFGHPVILVYAQSGAGKTSLFNASIAPKLEENGFDVLALTRVGGVVPKGIAVDAISNLYVFNALLKMKPGTDPVDLLTSTLRTFLETDSQTTADDDPPRPRVIIFDQFEELFTHTPDRWREQREDFFLQVVDALNANPLLRVVFIIREDFLAELDPYARTLPERLRTRYRLERLGESAALRAIQDPVSNTGRQFAPGVAQELVKGLLTLRSVDATGTMTEIEGQYVEPVQLQVVCVTLWNSLKPDVTEIQHIHLQNFNISHALSDFYRLAVESASREMRVPVQELRDWFEQTLITPMGTRSTVFRGEDFTGGIPNSAVDFLEGRHIIRAEFRAGARWYELTHDRMVEPILASNKEWFSKNTSLLQQQTALWIQQGRGDGLLLQGAELRAVEKEAGTRKLTDDERGFLNASRLLRRRRQTRSAAIAIAVIALSLLSYTAYRQSVLATINAMEANKQADIAEQNAEVARQTEREARKAQLEAEAARLEAEAARTFAQEATTMAESGRYAALAQTKSQDELVRALLFGVESFTLDDNPESRGALLDVASASPHFLQALYGHNDSVTGVAFSPDGRLLASGGLDNRIVLWDINTRQPIRDPLAGHQGSILSLTFSPGGDILASGSDDDTILLWDMQTFQPIGQPLKGHRDSVHSVAFSPDGKFLASGSWDDSIILWDVATQQQVGILQGHQDDVYTVAFSPNGQILASGGLDKTIILWDMAAQTQIAEPLKANDSYVQSLAFSPDGTILASAAFDNMVTLWDMNTRGQIGPLVGHSNWVSSVAFSPDGKTLASGSADGTIMLWDVATRQAKDRPLTGAGSVIRTIAFGPDGKTLASGDLDKAVILWDMSTPLSMSQSLTAHTAKVNALAISKNGRTLVSASDDMTFALWDTSSLQLIGSPHPDIGHYAEAVATSPDDISIAVGGYSTGILFWDMEKNSINTVLKTNERTYDYVFSLAFSPDGTMLASGTLEDSIILWDVTTSKRIGSPLAGHKLSTEERIAITDLAFSPDGTILASSSQDQTIILWEVATGKELVQLKGHTGEINAVAFSPDGKTLASASFDRSIILWDLETSPPTGHTLTGHNGAVRAVTFSPDGKLLASGGSDENIILWDMATERPIGNPLNTRLGTINSLVFAPDGKTLYSAGNTIVVWNLDPLDWLEESCRRAGRNFTKTEWDQYFPDEEYRKTCEQWPLETTTATP